MDKTLQNLTEQVVEFLVHGPHIIKTPFLLGACSGAGLDSHTHIPGQGIILNLVSKCSRASLFQTTLHYACWVEILTIYLNEMLNKITVFLQDSIASCLGVNILESFQPAKIPWGSTKDTATAHGDLPLSTYQSRGIHTTLIHI